MDRGAPVGRQGDTPEGIVERAEQYLAADRLGDAIQELNRLPARRSAWRSLGSTTRSAGSKSTSALAAIRQELSRS
jgi:hypothetical protein